MWTGSRRRSKRRRSTHRSRKSFPHAPFHFINRDFFDFTHEYSFDEVITELPKEAPEGERVRKLSQSVSWTGSRDFLSEDAVLIILTDHASALEEALKEVSSFTLAQSFLLNERAGTTEFVLRYR